MSVKDTAESPDSIEDRPPAIYKKQTAFRLAGPQFSSSSDTKPPVSEGLREVRATMRNPFKLPADNIFLLRNKENEQMKLERQRQKTLKVHEKVTYTRRIQAKQGDLRQELRLWQEDVQPTTPSCKAVSALRTDPAWRRAAIQGAHSDRENISEYIAKKREMFLIEHSLAVKREVIQKLADVATVEEKRLQQAEKFLEEDAAMFDEFLKENDKNSVQAIKIAEQETKAKMEKVSEMKRITGKIVAVKSDISKNEEILKEYTMYTNFLLKLSPLEWQEAQQARRHMVDKIKTAVRKREKEEKERKDRDKEEKEKREAENARPGRRRESVARDLPPVADPRTPRRQSIPGVRETTKPKEAPPPLPVSVPMVDESKLAEYEEPELYFTDPQQLLDLLKELEKQNLNLIQNSQETEEALEEFRLTMDNTRKRMTQETEQLTQQIDIISHAIQRERDRAAELELKARLFSFGKYKAEDQDVMLEKLGKKVGEVYHSCVGETEGNLTTLQMLTNIEGHLGELLENIELVPRDRVLIAERAKEKERRLRLRDEKVRVQKQQQEERLRKALERAQADIKRPTGRKLMSRSQPPVTENLVNIDDETTDLEREMQLYFFT